MEHGIELAPSCGIEHFRTGDFLQYQRIHKSIVRSTVADIRHPRVCIFLQLRSAQIGCGLAPCFIALAGIHMGKILFLLGASPSTAAADRQRNRQNR